ncbi:MAG: hypothetical protein ACR2PM_02700 [Hyphomicrobiales bacterium]
MSVLSKILTSIFAAGLLFTTSATAFAWENDGTKSNHAVYEGFSIGIGGGGVDVEIEFPDDDDDEDDD